MFSNNTLFAYCGTLVTIIVLAIAGAIAAKRGDDTGVYLAAITGLIGVLGTFKGDKPTANVQEANTVNQNTTGAVE